MKEFLSNHMHIQWEDMPPEAILRFDSQSNLFELLVVWISDTLFVQKYEEFKENIDPDLHKKFDDILDFDNKRYDKPTDLLYYSIDSISGKLHIEVNKLFFDGAQIGLRKDINAVIYGQITDEKYSDSEIAENIKQLHEALARNDYDAAALLNEKLAKYQIFSKVAVFYGDIISRAVEQTYVVTFTVPKFLLMLWEAAKGEKSIPEFLESNIRGV